MSLGHLLPYSRASPAIHYCCWAATPNYPMCTSLISITEPYHYYYPSISSVLRSLCFFRNDSYDSLGGCLGESYINRCD
jgi:hypothetical protein